MARYKPSALFSDIRGRLGEMIAQGWKSGILFVKRMPTSVANPNSAAQAQARDVVSVYSKRWLDVLSAAQRIDWETYALQQPGKYAVTAGVRELVGTNTGVMSGQNAYILTNGWLISAGLAGTDNAPLIATPPSIPTDVAAAFVLGELKVSWTDSAVKEVGAFCRVHIASVSGIFHKQIAAIVDSATAIVGITEIAGAKGSPIPIADLVGSRVYIQIDVVNPSGTKCGGSQTIELEI